MTRNIVHVFRMRHALSLQLIPMRDFGWYFLLLGCCNSTIYSMYLWVGTDGGGYTISVPIKMRSLSA